MTTLNALPLLLCLAACQTNAMSSFYADNTRGQSVPITKLPRKQQENVQKDLLEMMGLYHKPKPKTNAKIQQSASQFMRNLYESVKGLDGLDDGSSQDPHIHIRGLANASALGLDPAKVEGSDVIVSFVNYARKIPHLRHKKDSTFFFDFSEVSMGEQVRGAELRVYKEKVDRPELEGHIFHLQLYAIKRDKDWQERHLELESSIPVTWRTEGWLLLDAFNIASSWTLFPHMNYGLYLKVLGPHGEEYHPRDLGIVGRKGPADKQSFLVCYIDISPPVLERRTRSIRNRRWAEPDDVTAADNPYMMDSPKNAGFAHYSSHNNCEKHNLYINFREIGFDNEFLIAPSGYSAFYCGGECSFPLSIHMNATNHAIVQTLVNLMNPEDVPKPCCAPTEFGTITLLYYDDNLSVVLQRFRNMIVRACGCL